MMPGSKGLENLFRIRLAALSLVLSGVFFILFPVVRPFFDESSLQGAREFASTQWVVAHAFGMGGFIMLALGFLGLHILLRQTKVERSAFRALVLCWVGAGLRSPSLGQRRSVSRSSARQPSIRTVR